MLIISIIAGCNNNHDDNNFETDSYFGRFYYGLNYIETTNIIIVNKFDDSIVINNDTLEITSDSIIGKLDVPWSQNGLNLKGKYTGEVYNLNFEVDGTYTESGYNHGGSYTYSGTFRVTLE